MLLAHLPFTLMTSKGTPCRRYSSVDPMCMPCPCRGSRLALVAAVARAFKKAGLVRGHVRNIGCRFDEQIYCGRLTLLGLE